MIYGKFLMNKKKPSKILGCYLALSYGYMFFFSQKYHAAAVCFSADLKDDVSPAGFTWPARSCSWMFVISTTNSYKFRVYSRVHRGRTSRVWGLYKTWNSCNYSLFTPFYHLEYTCIFFIKFQLILHEVLSKFKMYCWKITFKEILFIFIPQQFMQNCRTPGSPSGKWFRYKSVSTTPGFTQHTSTSEWSRILSTQYICIIYNSNCHYVHCKFRHVFTLWSKIVKPQPIYTCTYWI